MDSNICAAVAPAVLKSVAVANGLAVFKSVTVYPAATKAVNEKASTICAIGAPAAFNVPAFVSSACLAMIVTLKSLFESFSLLAAIKLATEKG